MSNNNFFWLNKSYIKSIITNANLPFSEYEIENLLIEPATVDGANFSSVLLRVRAKFNEGRSLSMIVKTIVTQEIANDILVNQFKVHEKEMFVYGVLMPEYHKIFNENRYQIAPSVYYVDREYSAIILEDLSLKAFTIADKSKGLDEKHCVLTIQKLAKLHAASMVLNEKEPTIFKPFGVGMINRNIKLLHEYFQSCIDIAADEIRQWKGYEKYEMKLRNLKSNLIEKACSVFDFNEEKDTFVFLHGDLWTTNIMFKYEEGTPVDATLVRIFYILQRFG